MTAQIQQVLKQLLCSCTDIPEKSICLSRAEEGQMQALPWASIISATKQLTPLWQWDSATQQDGTLKRVRCKYRAFQPFNISIHRKSAEDASTDSDSFLKVLPEKILINDTVINLTPSSVYPDFGVGLMDESSMQISLNIEYGIYSSEETGVIKQANPIITNIN